MTSYLNEINKAFYILIIAGSGFRFGLIAMQLASESIDHQTAKKKFANCIKAAILATVINSLAVVIRKYYG